MTKESERFKLKQVLYQQINSVLAQQPLREQSSTLCLQSEPAGADRPWIVIGLAEAYQTT